MILITSDLHFPYSITARTFLKSNCGYTPEFYGQMESMVKGIDPARVEALIIDGDFFWDYRYFINFPTKVENLDFYNAPLLKLKAFRSWLDESIPLIFIEGNHDTWFQTYVFSLDGNGFVDLDSYRLSLKSLYKVSDAEAETVSNLLVKRWQDPSLSLGDQFFLLKNEGKMIGDFFVYGLPFYKNPGSGNNFTVYSEGLVKIFKERVALSGIDGRGDHEPLDVILCQHAKPPSKKFVSSFNIDGVNIKGLYWGHHHTISRDRADSLRKFGPTFSVMPELNEFDFVKISRNGK
ncbi:MAG: metallophosphoesterase [Promethearchaeota archaeon]